MDNPQVSDATDSGLLDTIAWYYGLLALLMYGIAYLIEIKLGKYL